MPEVEAQLVLTLDELYLVEEALRQPPLVATKVRRRQQAELLHKIVGIILKCDVPGTEKATS